MSLLYLLAVSPGQWTCWHSPLEGDCRGCSVSAHSPAAPSQLSSCSASEHVSYSQLQYPYHTSVYNKFLNIHKCNKFRNMWGEVCIICRPHRAPWMSSVYAMECIHEVPQGHACNVAATRALRLTLITDCFSLHTLQFHLLLFFTWKNNIDTQTRTHSLPFWNNLSLCWN